MGELLSRGSPKLCLSLTEATIEANLEVVAREGERVDILELRADFLSADELSHLKDFPRKAGLPAILAFRRESDGGAQAIDEAQRTALLGRGLEGGWSYVDLEEDLDSGALEQLAAERGTTVIRSLTDVKQVPSGLAARIGALPRRAAEIPKVAVTPRSTGDLLRLLDAATRSRSEHAVIVGMGDWGFPTRVLPSHFSSVLSYSTSGRRPAAPGQVAPEILRDVYRLGELSARPTVYCVIGNPVLHSRSPWIHNPALRVLGLDAVYVPIPVDDLSAFAELAERLPINGASVTVPHKEAVRGLLSVADASVEDAGACNTLVREGSSWHGYNTDIDGFLAPLRDVVGGPLAGRSALVVGAGGAARAVIAALSGAGCPVFIVNRSAERADALAARFGGRRIDVGKPDAYGPYDIVVQATSAGMTPNEDLDPLPGYRFQGTEIVYDLVYAPPRTRFLERAEASGCRIVGGREMLIRQAHAQFRLFTGRDYPAASVRPEFS